jgi:L-aminopeptidase/D-esterase-like protein
VNPCPPDAEAGSVNDTLTAVAGVRVGHWTDARARTGCTVVAFPDEGALASGAVVGAAPGTREVALLAPEKVVTKIHAIVLSGGSAFGLAAADGVVAELERRGIGHCTPAGPVPIVPAAVLYDLMVGDASVRPGAFAGTAALSAASAAPVPLGAVGVGTGATVGKLVGGFPAAVPSGLGSAVARVDAALVAALAVSNAAGDLVDPDDGGLVAGSGRGAAAWQVPSPLEATSGTSTSLVVVVTDAVVTKAQACGLAQAAHVGIARVTRPSHTVYDGDAAFVASTGRGPGGVALGRLGAAVQDVVARALVGGARAVRSA